jgi:hypothetical protein
MRYCRVGGGTRDRSMDFCCGREYIERSINMSRTDSDEAECLNGEVDVGGEFGDTVEGESDRDNAGTAEPKPAK